MTRATLKLKKYKNEGWKLYLPNGEEFGPLFKGDTFKVRESTRIFVSSWYNWTVDDSECYSKGEINEYKEN